MLDKYNLDFVDTPIDFYVCAMSQVGDYSQKHRITDFISINDYNCKTIIPGIDNMPNRTRKQFNFLDLQVGDVKATGGGTDYTIPTVDEVKPAALWVLNLCLDAKKKIEPRKVLINCYAGIGRSGAIAYWAYFLKYKDYQKALDILLQARPQIWPNITILKHIDDIFGNQFNMSDFIKEWKISQQGRLVV